MNFTKAEVAALRLVFAQWAKAEGEDVIGVLMKAGAFRCFQHEKGLTHLARKLEIRGR